MDNSASPLRDPNTAGDEGLGAPEVEDILLDLAGLTLAGYESQRIDAAAELGWRLAILDFEVEARRPRAEVIVEVGGLLYEPEPWEAPVDGETLVESLCNAIKRYIVMPDHTAEAVALWILHTHAHDSSTTSPILAALSPEKRCGKTSLLALLGALTPRSLPSSNITGPSLFRAVEAWKPTVLIDEADTFLRDNDDLRGILNSGHNKMTAGVVRCVGDDHEPKVFSTWSPKAIAMIGELPDTLADRSISVRLQRKRQEEVVSRLRGDRLGDLHILCRKASRWSKDNMGALKFADPDVPQELHDRAADNWRPLFAIADQIGGAWPQLARVVAVALSADTSDDSIRVMLLADIKAIFEMIKSDKISSADLIARLVAMEDRPWPEYQGKPITARKAAKLLAPHGISPGTVRFPTGNTAKGYKRSAFDNAFSTYLPKQTVTTSPPTESKWPR